MQVRHRGCLQRGKDTRILQEERIHSPFLLRKSGSAKHGVRQGYETEDKTYVLRLDCPFHQTQKQPLIAFLKTTLAEAAEPTGRPN